MDFIKNLLRALVEGLGSKKLFAAIIAVLVVFLMPVITKVTGSTPDAGALAIQVASALSPILLFILAQWHIDIKSEGKTTTAALMLDKGLKLAAALLSEKTIAHKVADAIIEATAPPVPSPSPVSDTVVPPSAPTQPSK